MLFLDCESGLSGDMLVAGFLDLGLPIRRIEQQLERLGLRDIRLSTRSWQRSGLSASQLVCQVPGSLKLPVWTGALIDYVKRSRARETLKKMLVRVLVRLAQAEAHVHRRPWKQTRLHQLSRPETLVNCVGFCEGLDHFKIRQLFASAIPMGRAHQNPKGSWVPQPGPSAQRLLSPFSIEWRQDAFEWTTPTAAALLATFASKGPASPFWVERIGHGAGHRIPPAGPSVLRFLLGKKFSK